MRPLVQECFTAHTPESLAGSLRGEAGLVLLRSSYHPVSQARYSFVAARPFLVFRSFGSRCEMRSAGGNAPVVQQFGNPWSLLEGLTSRYELLEELDLPFPLGGCFGYWGYDLKNFLEPKLITPVANDLELPDCQIGFYDSLVAFDHQLDNAFIISTGLGVEGCSSEIKARRQFQFWRERLQATPALPSIGGADFRSSRQIDGLSPRFSSTLSREEFIDRVERAQAYIRSGDIYQVNLSHRIATECAQSSWELFEQLNRISPAPFSSFLDCGEFQLISASPELFMRLSGRSAQTRPIKGTRPRSSDPDRDTQLSYELRTSPKEMAELVMITDLLRNDLGKLCEFGSISVSELARLERFAHVQHLVSTVEGRLRAGITHLTALASCFPGGSITGAPKFRAMEIIDQLEPVSRGPYTGALGFIGFNQESTLSIIIRTVVYRAGMAWFHTGAGIVADSVPSAEYQETLAKAQGFLRAADAWRPAGQSAKL